MAIELAAEVLFRFVFEALLYTLGYATGWLLIPVLSFGRYTVEPLSPPRRGARRTRTGGARPPRQVSAETASLVGLLLWVAVAGVGFALWWIARPG